MAGARRGPFQPGSDLYAPVGPKERSFWSHVLHQAEKREPTILIAARVVLPDGSVLTRAIDLESKLAKCAPVGWTEDVCASAVYSVAEKLVEVLVGEILGGKSGRGSAREESGR